MPVFKNDIQINGHKLWFGISYGEVVSQQKWSETEVYGGGNDRGISVSSRIHDNLEFWIKEKDGHEKHVQLKNWDGLGVRPGQKAWVVWGAGQGMEDGDYLSVGNVEAKTEVSLTKANWVDWWKRKVGPPATFDVVFKHLFNLVVAAAAVGFVARMLEPSLAKESMFNVVGGSVVLALCVFGWWLPFTTANSSRNNAAQKQYDAAREDIDQAITDMVAAEAAAYQASQQKTG